MRGIRTEQQARLALALAGLGSVGLYALLAGARYPVAPSLTNPRAGWSDLAPPTFLGLAYHVGIYSGLTALFLLALRLLLPGRTPSHPLAPPGRRTFSIIVLVWLTCSAVLMSFAPAGESHDIFDYIFRGRLMVEEGANPLIEVPSQYANAPYYRYIAWHGHVDTYGPVWEMASAATASLAERVIDLAGWSTSGLSCPFSSASCRRLTGFVTAYRLLAVGATGVAAALIVSMVRRSRPQLAAGALAAWLWSPLLLVSTSGGAHNDAVMMLLLMLVLWLLQRRRWFLALLVLALAAHVKLTALVVLPPVALWLVRQLGWRRATALCVAAGASGLLLSWLLYAPYGGWSSLPRMLAERTEFLANSPWRVLDNFLTLQRGWPVEQARRLTVQLPTALSAAAAALASLWMLDFRPRGWKAHPEPDWRDDRLLWQAVAAVSLLYLLLGSFWFQHWYVLWVLAPAALVPDSHLTRSFLPWLGFGALSANAVGGLAPVLVAEPLSKTSLAAILVAVTWAPAALAAVVWLGRRWRLNPARSSRRGGRDGAGSVGRSV